MARILLVGTVTLDLVFELEHHPGADEEMRARSLRTCRGGNAANTAVVLARLGHQPEFLGVLADAPETAVIERDFLSQDVDFSHCPKLPGRPPTSSIYLSGGSRSIVHYRELPELEAGYFTDIDLSRYAWVHFEGRNVPAVQAMMEYARNTFPNLPISLEVEKPREGIERLLGMADWLICSRGFANQSGFADAPKFLPWMQRKSPNANILAAWGAVGAFGLSPDGQSCHAVASMLTEVVDSLGAGDTFNAGVIDAVIEGCGLVDVLEKACNLAARKCVIQGFAL